MRWKRRNWPKPEPEEIRWRRVWAWWPILCSDNYYRWFVYVKIKEQWVATGRVHGLGGDRLYQWRQLAVLSLLQ